MERFTISLEPALARSFDALIAERGYQNRSEAVRDLLREKLGQALLQPGEAKWGVGTVSYIYDSTDDILVGRVLHLRHDHHDLVLTSQHTALDHKDGLETVTLRGPISAIQAFASRLIALRGVRNGHVHFVPLHKASAHRHEGPPSALHHHLEPSV
ncbi:MAG: nickel-responsive transcriptional regulator NikR [Ramlibacter sp.]